MGENHGGGNRFFRKVDHYHPRAKRWLGQQHFEECRTMDRRAEVAHVFREHRSEILDPFHSTDNRRATAFPGLANLVANLGGQELPELLSSLGQEAT